VLVLIGKIEIKIYPLYGPVMVQSCSLGERVCKSFS